MLPRNESYHSTGLPRMSKQSELMQGRPRKNPVHNLEITLVLIKAKVWCVEYCIAIQSVGASNNV